MKNHLLYGNIIFGGVRMDYLQGFRNYLAELNKSQNTIKSYVYNVNSYLIYYEGSYGIKFERLLRQNFLDYKSYLQNIKKTQGKNLDGKSINVALSSLLSFNKFLVQQGIQEDIVVHKSDFIRVQVSYVNPSILNKQEVEEFRQKILLDGDLRLYAVTSLMAYCGLRISEALDIRIQHLDLKNKELIVYKGKGGKQRRLFLSDKVVNALKEYLNTRTSTNEFLFNSYGEGRISRQVINKKFKKYSHKVTPHQLRHYFCTSAFESGFFGIHEVAYMAGHSSQKTSILYINPSIDELKRKMELL
jgi:integrase/recombinase XerD